MAIDVYVMPIWRFKTGDFQSPLEASGLVPTVHYVTPEGIFTRFDLRKRITRWRAKREVRAIAKAVSAANGNPVSWTDEGNCVYTSQFRGGDVLKAYIWWLGRQDLLGEFRLPDEGT
jgi:hypothetical protein